MFLREREPEGLSGKKGGRGGRFNWTLTELPASALEEMRIAATQKEEGWVSMSFREGSTKEPDKGRKSICWRRTLFIGPRRGIMSRRKRRNSWTLASQNLCKLVKVGGGLEKGKTSG